MKKSRLVHMITRLSKRRNFMLAKNQGKESTLTYWAGYNLGYLKGQISVLEDWKDELSPPEKIDEATAVNLRDDKNGSTLDILEKLVESANILLHEKNYDGTGWESISISANEAQELIIKIKQFKQENGK